MKLVLSILSVLILCCSCQSVKQQTIEGDLYFKLVDFQRIFDTSDSILTKIETSVRTVNYDTLTASDKKSYELLKFLVEEKLLRKPFIRLRLDNGSIKMVFLDIEDYQQLKNFNHNDLVLENKKIRVRAEVLKIKHDTLTAYKTIRVISIDKIDGKTYWSK